MSSIMKGLVDEQDIEETKKLSAQEKFKRSMKRAGYDMDAGAKRLQDLLDKQKKEREEFEKKETKDVSEDATLQFAAEITPTVNPHAGIKDRKFRGAIGEGLAKSDTTYIILTESCYGLDYSQRVIVEGIYNEFKPIIEATLNANQINQLFTNIEQGATAAGGNRTMIGKGIDAGKTVNQAIDNVGKWLEDTRPVQAFDQKYENLKTKISAKFPGLEKNLTAMGTWAKENPGKTAAIIGVLTTIAALSGGPAGGAIAGQILRGTTELLKGEKISTAVGKGVKTAAIGALAGYGIDKIGDMLSGGVRMVADNLFPGARKLNLSFSAYGTGPSTFQNIPDVVGRAEDLAPIQGAFNSAAKAWSNGDYSKAASLFQQAKDAAAKLSDPAFVAQLAKDQESRSAIMSGAKGIMLASDAFAAAAQGAASGAGQGGLKKQTTESNRLTEREVRVLFEGVMSWLGKKATNLTTKVTADKLMMAWKKAGSPTDSNQIIPILTQNGVSQDVINAAFNQLKIPVNAPMSKPQAQPSQQTTTQTVQPKANGAPQKPVLPAQQPLINPELQKRLAARKAGKPVYSGGLEEDLRKWFKEKWVRFGPDGKIRGACARGSSSEGKPKCLPQAKAHALGKKGRKYAAAKKRREDPNPERSGPAKNVATKKKSNEAINPAQQAAIAINMKKHHKKPKSESINEGLWDWIKDKLSNKNPIQWSENYYNFIIRNDPLYLQAYLNAVKNDPNYIEWKKNNPNAAQQSTSQANYTGSQNRPEQYQSRDDFTAPHGSSENELKMFVNGTKPAAIVPEPNFSTWAKVINSGKYWTKQLISNGKLHSIIIVQPGNEESGKQIYELVQNAMNLANQGDFRAYENSNYHRRLGKLLGYPKDKIEQWINNYFKDKVDLAKTKIDEQDLNETFDQPYKLKWYPGDMDEVTAYAEIPNGDDLSIMFNLDANEEGEEAWAVEFYRNGSQEVTGEGDAQRIFATVLSAIKTFIKKYKPNRITFSASKEVEQGQKIQSRANLYDRLVQRYASTLGYKAFRADTGNKVIYELSKIAKQVAEGLGNITYRQQKGKNKFSVEMLINGKSAGIFQYDADTGRTITELDPEFRGQGLGQRLILKGIYTAAMLGLDYVEDESRTEMFDRAIDSLADAGYIVNDDEYWYVTSSGEQFLKQGVAESFSDISGLLSASNLNKSFIITAELAEGGKKKFRVKAQNETVAIEKFKKHHSMAKIINVAEEGVEELDELKCWPGYSRVKGVPAGAPGSCKKKTNEDYQPCPECGGAMYEVSLMNEKKDACYYKVKSRYKVWPSAYASGALVKCRKKGASNWGNKSKSNEGQIYSTGGGAGQSYRYYTPKDNLGESNIMAGILGQKNEK